VEITRVELKKAGEGACVFLEEGLCRVYPARPALCRLGPFTAGYMRSRKYFSLFRSICRGIGKGRFHPAGQIKGLLRQGQLLETQYERDLCTDPFLKAIFRTLPVMEKEIIIGRTYKSYLNAED
jgi:Fe-S-cluster containining protein